MLHGLLWFPLLFFFFWLAWAGWNEYQKLEAYRAWAAEFERAKYDIYAVLGQKGDELTWGKPTRQQPVALQTLSLKDVESIHLMVNDRTVDPDQPGTSSRDIVLALKLPTETVTIPFTDLEIAVQWAKFLQQYWQTLKQPC